MTPPLPPPADAARVRIIPFKLLILCLVLPPMLYLLTVSFLESWLQATYDKATNNVYLSDMNNILNGLSGIRESIGAAIDAHFRDSLFVSAGGDLDIRVTTRTGTILYPATYQTVAETNLTADPVKLAEKNFALLNDGLDVAVNVKIRHTSLLAVSLLLFYELIFLGGLYQYYRVVRANIRREERQKAAELDRLQALETRRQEEIAQLALEREALLSDFEVLQSTFIKEKSQLEKTEEDLFLEIETLEQKLSEIDLLKEKIQELEADRQVAAKQKEKAAERIGKRLKTLYKNIDVTARALDNLADMTEELGIKAEEIIHQLNADPALVPVKRKVFTKKGNATVFEVVFSYNGRLYFRKSRDNRVEVLTIGTKNTQQKDLTYLDSL